LICCAFVVQQALQRLNMSSCCGFCCTCRPSIWYGLAILMPCNLLWSYST